jgi:hypothetical protein
MVEYSDQAAEILGRKIEKPKRTVYGKGSDFIPFKDRGDLWKNMEPLE